MRQITFRRFIGVALIALLASSRFAAAQPSVPTMFVNGSCGNDAWTGTSAVCAAPNGPKATVEAAVAAASDFDVIEVADGTYLVAAPSELPFTKQIEVRSENGRDFCTLGARITFSGNTTIADSVLDGFTIYGFYGTAENGCAINFAARRRSRTAGFAEGTPRVTAEGSTARRPARPKF